MPDSAASVAGSALSVVPLAALCAPWSAWKTSQALGLAAAVLAELEAAGRVDTAGGQSALTLARRIEDGRDTGSAIASLNREMRATLAEAVKGAKVPLSSIESYRDELADRRRA